MTHISESLRSQVKQRASQRCEYCLYPEQYAGKRFHIDHIYAEKHGGKTDETNLCFCCPFCNTFKGSDLCSIDPQTNEIATLFHPRRDTWTDHFALNGSTIEPITAAGRVTARLLRLNDQDRVVERDILIRWGKY